MGKKILLITGSMNQTSQMLSIANELPDYECWFSQVFSDSPVINYFTDRTSLLDKTVLAHPFRKKAEQYLRAFDCRIDYRARINHYDLIVCCTDLVMPSFFTKTKTVWVQEGMIDRLTTLSKWIKKLKLPPTWCFNTSLNGSTNSCDLYCAASAGYKDHLSRMGTDPSKVFVTGIPNYDNAKKYLDNDFPHHDYVMVATTDMRETARWENRPRFIKDCVAIANGRQLLFKLHPNENFDRAIGEIRKYAPENALIYTDGNTSHMIANCCELITQYSTVVYTGIALNKKVHSWFDTNQLRSMTPIQNNGTSARNIANVCRHYIEFEGSGDAFIRQFHYQQVQKSEEVYLTHKEQYHAG